MLQPIITAEELESANEDLRIEQEITSLESYIDKHDGMMMMGHALNAMPKMSIEAAALTEVASAILARGTDLSGVDDFVPGLESMALQGLEAEGTGQGFLDKAKKVGAAILEKLKALWTKLLQSINNFGSKLSSLADSVSDLKDRLLKAGDYFEYELPDYRIEALKNPASKPVTDFVAYGPIADIERLLNATNDESRMDEFNAAVQRYLKVLTPVGKPTRDREVEITEIYSKNIHVLELAQVEGGKLTSTFNAVTRPRTDDEVKTGRIEKRQLVASTETIRKLTEALMSWVKELGKENKKVESVIANVKSIDNVRELMALSKLHFFIFRTVPSAIIDSLNDTVHDAVKLTRTSN